MSEDYSSERNNNYTMKLRAMIDELPKACGEYFRGIESISSPLTRYGYALDLRLFFKFLMGTELCSGKNNMREIDYAVLDSVEVDHVERFLEYISLYPSDDEEIDELIKNGDRGKARKLSSIRSFFR
ncbi:MAG: integrase, partial [Clostridiales bacterium]|nr:integrase [Clostridiales bacterium]